MANLLSSEVRREFLLIRGVGLRTWPELSPPESNTPDRETREFSEKLNDKNLPYQAEIAVARIVGIERLIGRHRPAFQNRKIGDQSLLNSFSRTFFFIKAVTGWQTAGNRRSR
jgi:hypothetical protein